MILLISKGELKKRGPNEVTCNFYHDLKIILPRHLKILSLQVGDVEKQSCDFHKCRDLPMVQ